MEKVIKSISEAKRYYRLADHMLTVTYPVVNEPKLLLTVLENLFLSLSKAIAAILYYERYQKNIPPFHETFESKFNSFRLNIAQRHNIRKEDIEMIEDIKDIIVQHRNSPVEFVRKGVFVICSDNYNMKTLNMNDMKRYLKNTKVFIADIFNNINYKNERIIR